jgi:hypothetical protein
MWRSDRPPAVFIGLNPSTADALQDDPTVRRCIRFARDWGDGGLLMLNAFAYRATDPTVMRRAPDPVGPENDRYIGSLAPIGRIVVCCWGRHGDHLDRDTTMYRLVSALPASYCLGLTTNGQPKHPLYLARDTPLEQFTAMRP